jgi:hypothetical protein
MNKPLKYKLLAKERWIRGLIMVFFIIIKYLVSWLINIVALFQFITDLVTGAPNSRLLKFSKNLNIYLLQIVNFLAFNSDIKPFPFTDWPKE